jgi:hypothetical protein
MRQVKRRGWVWPSLAAALAIPLTEGGHTLAYLGRYGPQGLHLESVGAHAYFPDLLRLSACVVGLVLLVSLVLLATGRVLIGRGLGLAPTGRQAVLPLFLTAAIVQLDCYLVQETLETLLSGQPFTFGVLGSILLWGAVGQLPLAAALACAVSWLSVRLTAIGERLRQDLALCAGSLGPPPALTLCRGPQLVPPATLGVAAGQALRKRGPPRLAVSR